MSMASTTHDVVLRIDGVEHDLTVVAHDTDDPTLDAPNGDGNKLSDMGRLCVVFPNGYSGPRTAHVDHGASITMMHGETETPCVMLMQIVGNGPYDAYLWLEPDSYFEWVYLVAGERGADHIDPSTDDTQAPA